MRKSNALAEYLLWDLIGRQDCDSVEKRSGNRPIRNRSAMMDTDAYALRLLRHDDRKVLKEIEQLKKNPPESGEPILYLTLARYENNPFLLYSCLLYARSEGISIHFSPTTPTPIQPTTPKLTT